MHPTSLLDIGDQWPALYGQIPIFTLYYELELVAIESTVPEPLPRRHDLVLKHGRGLAQVDQVNIGAEPVGQFAT
ncbi:MAG: hypothetical protein U5L98_10340 [Halomonas sp.]|nr:hypothetical protein [Halomonas sp.]